MARKPPDWTASWKQLPAGSPFLMKVNTWTRIRSYYKLFSFLTEMREENPPKSCLEIGAGTGYTSKILAERYGLEITMVDNNEEAYRMFQKTSGKGKYVIENAFSFKSKEKFDIVFSDGLIEHFYREERMRLIEVHRNLTKPDGFVIIFVPKKSWVVENILDWKGVLEFKFTFLELEAEMREAGLEPLARAKDWHMLGVLSRLA